MSDGARRIPPLRAGRKPAGRALLGWLADPRAPRLCRVGGSPGAGKTHLLTWFGEACAGEQVPERQRVHAVLTGERLTVDSALWLLGRRLGHLAHSTEELLTALADEGRPVVVCVPDLGRAVHPSHLVAGLLRPLAESELVRLVVEAPDGGAAAAAFGTVVPEPAVLDLDRPEWTDPARFAAWAASVGGDPAAYPSPGAADGSAGRPAETAAELIARVPRRPDGRPDIGAADAALLGDLWTAAAKDGSASGLLADAQLLTRAEPVAVTAAMDFVNGPVPDGWTAAGPALVGEDDPAVRAAVLRTRLIGMDDTAADRLAEVPAPWRAEWAMWPGSSKGWPGPVAGLAVGTGGYAGQLLLADPGGVVRTVDAPSGRPLARVVLPEARPLRGLASAPDGTVLLLDAEGTAAVLPEPAGQAAGQPAGAAVAEQALQALKAAVRGELSALTTTGAQGLPAVADDTGSVHRCLPEGGTATEKLHDGPVTALAGTAALLVSGGFDGTVRRWDAAAQEPAAEPVDRRGSQVTAVAAADTPAGPVTAAAWADGLVRLRRPGADAPLDLRLGSQVWALALTGDLLVAGTGEGVAAIRY
ncbi:WD40 repeat domain-containing protein [Kitasatospora sp. DSM 101779]|uniref:WD40 repeat domain-containing protein n=1 Tax=Kitasatospora sp. DSM 101779 TaxID=2853165 RepID=UPI0021D8F73E|nr:WD40 repeat domain-containing protein [Kitasatospora sp. DSM 101779]MCU7823746.1 WD40 domain-containing protein [Kitasatospora sp. DSM 101779]